LYKNLSLLNLLRKLLRHNKPDPNQLALQLDFFSSDFLSQPRVDHPAPKHEPETAQQPEPTSTTE